MLWNIKGWIGLEELHVRARNIQSPDPLRGWLQTLRGWLAWCKTGRTGLACCGAAAAAAAAWSDSAPLPSVLPRPLQATHAYFGFPISRQERREWLWLPPNKWRRRRRRWGWQAARQSVNHCFSTCQLFTATRLQFSAGEPRLRKFLEPILSSSVYTPRIVRIPYNKQPLRGSQARPGESSVILDFYSIQLGQRQLLKGLVKNIFNQIWIEFWLSSIYKWGDWRDLRTVKMIPRSKPSSSATLELTWMFRQF